MVEIYGIRYTRPNIKGLYNRALVLLQYGKIGLAKKRLEEIIKLNKYDNLGARYILLAVYAYFEDEKNFNKLYKKYNEDCLFFLVPQMYLAYKLGDTKKALNILKKIKKVNPYFVDILLSDASGDYIKSDYYQPGEKSEVAEVLITQDFLINSSAGLLKLIAENSK